MGALPCDTPETDPGPMDPKDIERLSFSKDDVMSAELFSDWLGDMAAGDWAAEM